MWETLSRARDSHPLGLACFLVGTAYMAWRLGRLIRDMYRFSRKPADKRAAVVLAFIFATAFVFAWRFLLGSLFA